MKTATAKEIKTLGKMTYGAPELKSLYQKYAFRGLVYSIALAFVVIGCVAVYSSIHANVSNEQEHDRNIVILDYDLPVHEKIIEAPPPVAEVKTEKTTVALKDLKALTPEPVAKENSEVLSTKTQEKLNDLPENVSHEGTDDLSKVTSDLEGKLKDKVIEEHVVKEEPVKVKNDQPFQSYQVEKSPIAVNLSSVRGSMKYPEIAVASQVEGTCVAKILVGTSGEILKVASISGPEVFHSEIENKVMNLQFTPALQNGQSVKCYVNVPFKFTLGKKKTDE